MTPIHQIYHVSLTPEEYQFLYRLAPEGIQAAMAATLTVSYAEITSLTRSSNELRHGGLREGRATAH